MSQTPEIFPQCILMLGSLSKKEGPHYPRKESTQMCEDVHLACQQLTRELLSLEDNMDMGILCYLSKLNLPQYRICRYVVWFPVLLGSKLILKLGFKAEEGNDRMEIRAELPASRSSPASTSMFSSSGAPSMRSNKPSIFSSRRYSA